MTTDTTQRFSDRVANYVRYRPSYPLGVIDLLKRDVGLHAGSVIADIGSGSGISAKLLLGAGCEVYAVEPNREMREAAEYWLRGHAHFHSIEGTAEATTLPDQSVDGIVAAQAFHWFDQSKTRIEFNRILKPEGFVVLLWNARHLDTTPFLRGYEALVQTYATDYGTVRHENFEGAPLKGFFNDGMFTEHTLPNAQHFDFEGLQGRLMSCSYAPAESNPHHAPMVAELRRLFDECQSEGRVSFEYDTRVYVGR